MATVSLSDRSRPEPCRGDWIQARGPRSKVKQKFYTAPFVREWMAERDREWIAKANKAASVLRKPKLKGSIRISLARGEAANAFGQAASVREHSLAQGQAASASKRQAHEEVQEQAANAAGQAPRVREYSSAQEVAGSHRADSSNGLDIDDWGSGPLSPVPGEQREFGAAARI